MERRQFIGSLGALTGGILFGKTDLSLAGQHDPKSALKLAVDDDAFWGAVRAQFLFPEDYIYFNTGGIGAVPSLVMNHVQKCTFEDEKYPRPGHDHKKWDDVKELCTGLLGPGVKMEEIALVGTATEGINIILNGLPLKSGDEVITTTHEHPALHVPLLSRMQRDGIKIRVFDPDLESGLGNVERINDLINRRTRLIFISHVTCTTGQCFPVKEIGQLAKDKDIWFALDGAQAGAQNEMDMKDWNIDFHTFSGHKWTLGPKRTGVLYVREELLDTLRPITVGAYSDGGYSINDMTLKFHPTAQRYEYATQNAPLFYGLGKAVDYIHTIGLKKIWEHNRKLAEKFYNGLNDMNGIEILSPKEEKYRTAMITFRPTVKSHTEVSSHLNRNRIRVRGVGEAGLNGIRVSFHVYNNEDEVDRILTEIGNV
ncbi:MAG: aminotransferase class V-fold PLP-dependent enzyme [bacterium]|nr:aminotransferase class V-fold PLP-dependent enzyme [bacterium]